jgi:hypothetical protein
MSNELKKMRKFKVWAGCGHSGVEPHEVEMEFDGGTPQKEIDRDLQDCVDTLIGNYFDTGWEEVDNI